MRLFLSAGLAALGFAATAGALLTPALLSEDALASVFIAAFVVGVQSSQSSYVQVNPLPFRHPGALLSICLAVSAAAAVAGSLPDSAFIMAILATLSGAALGLPLGGQASDILSRGNGLQYQAFQLARALVILLAAAFSSLLWDLDRASASASLSLTLGVAVIVTHYASPRSTMTARSGGNHGSTLAVTALLLLGVLSALYYRNDVTWVRASVSSSPVFETWHVGLVTYSAVQGVVGFLVVQRLFANRSAMKTRLIPVLRGRRLIILFSWLGASLMSVLACFFVSSAASLAVAILLAVSVGVASGATHVVGISWAPYVGGAVGTTAILISIYLGVPTSVLLPLSSTLTGLIIIFAWFRLRPVS